MGYGVWGMGTSYIRLFNRPAIPDARALQQCLTQGYKAYFIKDTVESLSPPREGKNAKPKGGNPYQRYFGEPPAKARESFTNPESAS